MMLAGRFVVIAIVSGISFVAAVSGHTSWTLAQTDTQRRPDVDRARPGGPSQPGEPTPEALSKSIEQDGRLQPRAEEDDRRFTSWMTVPELQAHFDRQVKANWYPAEFEGRTVSGRREFRGRFEPFPPAPFHFWAYFGMSQNEFERRDREVRRSGFRILTKQVLTDRNGTFVQATWVRP